jgi:uncharacterized protein YaiL (DUF2058 family)
VQEQNLTGLDARAAARVFLPSPAKREADRAKCNETGARKKTGAGTAAAAKLFLRPLSKQSARKAIEAAEAAEEKRAAQVRKEEQVTGRQKRADERAARPLPFKK